ncbi:MAG: glycosyltransferase family 9 protein [Sphingobacteriales bacterium JAD_PAG50586_3]|nr:MAG: glycosyltransferase family 9 protein [Sphingobacteriales bacterium JAD_PAG50586_3]
MKILIVRFSSIGDIVLTTPVIRCIKQQVAGAEVHYLTKASFARVLQANHYIDKLILIEKDIHEVIAELKAEHYDYVIDLHNNLRSRRLTAALKVKHSAFYKLNFKKLLLVNFKINAMPAVHIVDRYLDAAKKFFDIKNDGAGLDYFIPEADVFPLTALPAAHQKGYVAVVIAATYATKRMPPNRLIELCNRIDKPIVLLGGTAELQLAELVAVNIGDKIYNACGKFNLNQSASLVKQSLCVITPDTGLMHIAAAFKKRVLSIWGNTVPEFGMYPYMPAENSILFEVRGLSCRPCSKLGYNHCPKGHFKCMNNIDLEKVIEAIG